jgi:hypothetical protein
VKELGKLTPYVRNKGGLLRKERPQRKGSGNCLSKTQHCAKAQADVYSVTLAQCWNVMEEGQRKRSSRPKHQSMAAVTMTVLR